MVFYVDSNIYVSRIMAEILSALNAIGHIENGKTLNMQFVIVMGVSLHMSSEV